VAPLGLSAAYAANRWSDISDQTWFDTYGITAAQVAAVADGYPDGTFRPYQAVTRAQFAKMAVKGLGIPLVTPGVPSFSDVRPSHPLYAYVESARAAGILGGYANGTFRPDAAVTRQQTNSMLGRFLSEKELEAMAVIWGLQLSYPSLDAWYRAEGMFWLGVFTDLGEVDGAHRAGSAYLVCHHVVRGSMSGSRYWLYPVSSLNRAQAVTMVLRTLGAVDEVAPGAPPAPRDIATFPSTPSADRRPWVSGKAVPGGTVTLFDTFGGTTRQIGQILAHDLTGDFSLRVPAEGALEEGVHVFTLRVRNTKGLLSDYSAAVSYEVDWTPPTAVVTEPTDGALVSSGRPVFTVEAEDSGSGVLEVAFEYASGTGEPDFQPISIDYTPPYAVSWGALMLPEGEYRLRASVRDEAGNLATTSPVAITVDTTPPVAQLVSPAPALPGQAVLTEQRRPLFVVAAGDFPKTPGAPAVGVAEVRFLYAPAGALPEDPTVGSFTQISAESIPVDNAHYAASWGTLELTDGQYVLAAVAYDRAGNESALVSQPLVVDNAPPEVAVTAPVAGAVLHGGEQMVLTWRAADVAFAPAPIFVDFSPDDGGNWFVVAAGVPNSGTYLWQVPRLTVDSTTCLIRVTAVDAMGRSTTALSEWFTIIGGP